MSIKLQIFHAYNLPPLLVDTLWPLLKVELFIEIVNNFKLYIAIL